MRHTLTPVLSSPGVHKTAEILRGSASVGRTKLYLCECGAHVGWVKSAKTGKWYLAGAMDSQNPDSEREYVAAWWVHTDVEHSKVIAANKPFLS